MTPLGSHAYLSHEVVVVRRERLRGAEGHLSEKLDPFLAEKVL